MDKKRVMALVLSTVMALSGAACSTPASKETWVPLCRTLSGSGRKMLSRISEIV